MAENFLVVSVFICTREIERCVYEQKTKKGYVNNEGVTTPPLARKCKDDFPDLCSFRSLISS
jgi:hypothetical protein